MYIMYHVIYNFNFKQVDLETKEILSLPFSHCPFALLLPLWLEFTRR